jgi:TolB protein
MSPHLLAIISALVLATPAQGAEVAVDVAVQVTHGDYDDPSFSPDGRRMVAIARRAGREQLAVLNADGTSAVQITRAAYDHEDPAWSPDGRHIAYVSMADGGEVIHIMDPDGAHDRAVTPPGQRTIHPSWSPDSRSLVYCTDDDLKPPAKNAAEIYQLDLATGARRVLIAGGVNTYPNLSADGRRIAFRRMVGETNSEVFVARRNGSGETNITNSPAFDGWPAWSPDGREIAFASNRAGNHKIYVMAADGSDPRLIADTPGRGTAPKWTRDGQRIYFTICQRTNGAIGCEIYSAKAR